MSGIQYVFPDNWIKYDFSEILSELTDAKASILAIQAIPFQKRWVEELQKIQLKMEIAGTTQIEGADFAGNELEVAIQAESPEASFTRSQKQATAVTRTYKTIAGTPADRPVDAKLICGIHASIVSECDEDHCNPGVLRDFDNQVTFGRPTHRGALAGEECKKAFETLATQVQTSYRGHEPLIQALALHYHFAAIHPFGDGNGRTARALEALMLQRAGLKESLFIAMSNYYYDEKNKYLETLAAVRASNHNLTAFLKFGLKGVTQQSRRLYMAIREEVSKQIFRNLMRELFFRLENTRKRVIVKRQLTLLEKLLDTDGRVEFFQFAERVKELYSTRKEPIMALVRDVNRLNALGAIKVTKEEKAPNDYIYHLSIQLDWPSTITETEFFSRLAHLPKSKTFGFLSAEEL
jgi:cell filamentation protein, protein adenylyltransferase